MSYKEALEEALALIEDAKPVPAEVVARILKHHGYKVIEG